MAKKQAYKRRSPTSTRMHLRRAGTDLAMCGLSERGLDSAGRERILWIVAQDSVETKMLAEKACKNCERNAMYERYTGA